MKTCEICGKTFESPARTCSRQCGWKLKVKLYGKEWMGRKKKPLLILICEWCQKEFESKYHRRCCSKSCASQSREWNKGNARVEVRQCLECGGDFVCMKSRPKVFCNRSCAQKNKLKRPEYRATLYNEVTSRKISEKQKAYYATEAGKETAKRSSERLKRINLMQGPDIVAKMKATKERNGTLRLWKEENRGGNGKISVPQQKLFDALGEGWELELAIPTQVPRKPGCGYPTNYKADLGNRELKLAVEVDGKMHRSKRVILLDAKKTRKLEELGWTVLRFTNEAVMTCLSLVLLVIETVAEDLSSSSICK